MKRKRYSVEQIILTGHYPVSGRQACRLSHFSRTAYYREPQRGRKGEALRLNIRDLAQSRVRYGYKRSHVLLKREGIHVNHKRVHRLYCLEGLQIKARRPKQHVSASHRQSSRVRASGPDVA